MALCSIITDGDHQPPPQTKDGVPFLVIGDVVNGQINLEGTRSVTQGYYDDLQDSRRPTRDDILFTVTGSYGIVIPVHANEPFCVQRHIAILRPLRGLNRYLVAALKSGMVKHLCDSSATGIAQKTVGLNSLRCFLLPIPPLAEQQRIATVLDNHLTCVDNIEREQAELDELLAKARSKVLDLAIRGKLVPQDPADEPASVLLERIHQEKLQMVADGKLKKKDVAGDSVIFRGEDNYHFDTFKQISGSLEILGLSPWNDFHIFESVDSSKIDSCLYYYFDENACSAIKALLPRLASQGRLHFSSVKDF